MRFFIQFIMITVLGILLLSCAAQKTQEQLELEAKVNNIIHSDKPVYLAHNLWYEHQQFIEAINFKGLPHLITAGTEVGNIEIRNPLRQHNIYTQFISFYVKGENEPLFLVFSYRYQQNEYEVLTIEDLLLRTFTHEPFEVLTSGLKDKEIENIKHGLIMNGMSKRAVLISWGYPPLHKTPGLDATEWQYWKRRVQNDYVIFDGNERVTEASWYGYGVDSNDVIE